MSAILAANPELPSGLVRQPLEWFAAEHFRHRQFCALMHELAQTVTFEARPISALLEFLRHELGRHLADEEQDLFPLLRRRARAEDQVDEVLDRLEAEHRGDLAHSHALRAHLERCLRARTAPGQDPAAKLALDAFATQELRHLALENAVVLPLARLRLTGRDLKTLSRRLAARRGLQPRAAA
jgi:iron-sulfur cluster repair protein YtfE (RIC family)